MQIRQLSIPGAVEFTPRTFSDDRGLFLEWFRHDVVEEAIGHPFALKQANTSVSRRGALRGIHYADVPTGQAKYVTVTRGAVLDFVVDIRVGSETFGRWEAVLLDTVERRALYLSEGLGHAFVALEDDSVVSYLCTDVFRPEREHGIDPLDPVIGLDLPLDRSELLLSDKDARAPGLIEARDTGLLPEWEACESLHRSQRSEADR